jgi:hypothetical protein
MSTKSHICKKCGILRMKIFSIMGYAQIHKQRPFFDNQKDISKTIVSKIQIVNTCIDASSTHTLYVS